MQSATKKLIQQNAWTCSFEENMRWAQGEAEEGRIEAALVVADVAFHQLRSRAIQREKEKANEPY